YRKRGALVAFGVRSRKPDETDLPAARRCRLLPKPRLRPPGRGAPSAEDRRRLRPEDARRPAAEPGRRLGGVYRPHGGYEGGRGRHRLLDVPPRRGRDDPPDRQPEVRVDAALEPGRPL